MDWRRGATRNTSVNASESMIERFDLFTIIVLGEVIVGVVNGIAYAGSTPIAVVTGILAWVSGSPTGGATSTSWEPVGFPPDGGHDQHARARVGGHAPALAAMVLSLLVAVGVLVLVLIATSLADWRDLAPVYRPVSVALGMAAGAALLLGWLAPPPWLHIVLLTLVLGAVWIFGILTWFAFTHHAP